MDGGVRFVVAELQPGACISFAGDVDQAVQREGPFFVDDDIGQPQCLAAQGVWVLGACWDDAGIVAADDGVDLVGDADDAAFDGFRQERRWRSVACSARGWPGRRFSCPDARRCSNIRPSGLGSSGNSETTFETRSIFVQRAAVTASSRTLSLTWRSRAMPAAMICRRWVFS